MLTDLDFAAVGLSLRLAAVTTIFLFVIGTPIAWWLANTHSKIKGFVFAVVALPLILPPTVLGFYLLIALAPSGPLGFFAGQLLDVSLPFTFAGLVIASVVYSLPFVVHPLYTSFDGLDKQLLEAAGTLGAGKIDRMFSIVLPACKAGIITAGVLGFAHTLGEFGVILMIGGNIPEQTQVISVRIYEQVELMNYAHAHVLAGGMLVFSLFVLLVVYGLRMPRTIEMQRVNKVR